MKKHTQEFIEKYFLDHGGYVVEEEYQSSHKPIKISKDGYFDSICFANFQGGAKPSWYGERCPYHDENIKLYLKRKFPSITFEQTIFHKKKGGQKSTMVVYMICECGRKFNRSWNNLYKSKILMCYQCECKRSSNNQRALNRKKYLNNLKIGCYELVDKNAELLSNTLVEVFELKTGYNYRGFVYPNRAHKQNMSIFGAYKNISNYMYNVNQYINHNNLDVQLLRMDFDKEKSNVPSLLLKCSCGEPFASNIYHLIDGKYRCNKCSKRQSLIEEKVERALKELGLEYIKEYKINSCADVLPLPFDFFIKEVGALIEVDGEQHYRPVRFGGCKTLDIDKQFEQQKRRDKIKDDYCLKYNIPLLRIPYFVIDEDTHKSMIHKFVQTIQD